MKYFWEPYLEGMFRSTDNGDSWQEINTGINQSIIQAVTVTSDDFILAATDKTGGIYRSTDNGQNWTLVNSGLTNTNIRSLAESANGDVFAGSEGGGVFRSDNKGV